MSTATMTERQAPATFRPGAFQLRDTWFPLVHANQVGRRPVARSMHGHPVFFWRDGGRLRATEHRPEARRTGGELTHGSGEYLLVERYGYAWVWFGDPANASPDLIPCVPHLPLEGMPRRFQANVVFDCTYELVCENLLDLTHADFLHSALTGDALSEDDVITVESTSETVTMIRTAHGRDIPKMQRPMLKGHDKQDVRLVTITYVRSGVCVLHGNYDPGMSIRMLHPVNPESRVRSRTPVTFDPQNMPRLGRELFPYCAHMVGRQDNWAVKVQNESYGRPRPNADLSSRFDKAGLRYRKIYQQLVARQQQGDFSYLADGDPGRDTREELGLAPRR
jgi:phenylpropionate dioxygenase-like ring-hydroxylating dioxygenase large terminal subunit